MAAFDPEKFEDKYEHYFTQLQSAYRNAFETMNDAYDSELIHGIDQQVLAESEPMFEDGAFRIDLPEDPYDRLDAVVVDRERFEAVLERYREELRAELRETFDLE
jgi:uncharacterized protein YeaO (DUF488 family)